MRKLIIRKKYVLIVVPIILVLAFVAYVILINIAARSLDKYTEITFINPTQALVFWKSEKEALGYVKYGTSKWKIRKTELQTSSEKGLIHVVLLANVPLEGIYIKKYTEGENIFIFHKINTIKYIEESTND
ncbi:MAG: hypothetical protein US24_C0027G0002 [candidate division WS6 bacterium GW2011_GWC2_36_7]|uniref:Uncharacterized protein n=1 Tax=candidate division WS6 bacterium GW2011_GWC2_36_7 TaxID=1619091 RepID=A0A0G0EWS9_9BACT|nr:MAG: hypothetical protein US24_C0027G0002 [candidate division WS6 bacterium GW2011_GWC2_36_7]